MTRCIVNNDTAFIFKLCASMEKTGTNTQMQCGQSAEDVPRKCQFYLALVGTQAYEKWNPISLAQSVRKVYGGVERLSYERGTRLELHDPKQ